MNILKTQLARIQQQMAQLTPSQRMLAIALVVIMAMTMVYWGKYASQQDRVALSDKSFGSQANQFVTLLNDNGVTASVTGDGKIMIPPDQQSRAAGILYSEGSLPADNSDVIDKIMAQSTLWDSAEKTATIRNEKKQAVLGQIIRSFPSVAGASVVIDPSERRSLSGEGSQPRATISIKLKSGQKLNKKQVLAAASTVAGAQANLQLANIVVIVDGIPQAVENPNDESAIAGANSLLEAKTNFEISYQKKIAQQLTYVNNPLITVNVTVNSSKTEEVVHDIDQKKTMQKEIEQTNKTTDSTQTNPNAVEPGVSPNTGASIGQGATNGGGTSSNNVTESTKMAVDWWRKDIKTSTPAGDGTVEGAAVQIPRSHITGMWKKLNPKATAEPEDADLEKVRTTELAKITKMVARTLKLEESKILVDDYIEVTPEVAAIPQTGIPVMTLVSGYGKEAALGVMALAAMAMVSGIVKKGNAGVPAAVTAAAGISGSGFKEDLRGGISLDRLVSGQEVVGSATEGGSTLEAMELDEETGQTAQMVEQVSTMVKENPDAATSLIKRWMARE